MRSAGATQWDTLASAATAIGAIANRLPSASAPVTKTEQILCRMRGSATPIGTYAERPVFRIYNGLLPSKFTSDLKAGMASAGMVKGTSQMSLAYSPMARSDENHAM